MSQRLTKLFPIQRGTPKAIAISSLVFCICAFYFLQYLPKMDPSSQIPEFPVLLLFLMGTPFLMLDIAKRGYRFLRNPRKGGFLYALGLSREQRRSLVLKELKSAFLLLRLFAVVAMVVLFLLESLLLKEISGSSLIFILLLTLLISFLPMAFYRFLQRVEGSNKDLQFQRRGGNCSPILQKKMRLTQGLAEMIARLCSPTERVAVQRLWLYLLREGTAKNIGVQLALLFSAVVLTLLLFTAGTQYLLAQFLILLVAAAIAINMTLSSCDEAQNSLRNVTYYPFSSERQIKSFRLFASVLIAPYGVLLLILWGAHCRTLPAFVLLFNSSLLLICVSNLFSLLLTNKGRIGSEMPLWYPVGTIGLFLLFLLSWGGSVALTALLVLLHILLKKRVARTDVTIDVA